MLFLLFLFGRIVKKSAAKPDKAGTPTLDLIRILERSSNAGSRNAIRRKSPFHPYAYSTPESKGMRRSNGEGAFSKRFFWIYRRFLMRTFRRRKWCITISIVCLFTLGNSMQLIAPLPIQRHQPRRCSFTESNLFRRLYHLYGTNQGKKRAYESAWISQGAGALTWKGISSLSQWRGRWALTFTRLPELGKALLGSPWRKSKTGSCSAPEGTLN